MTEIRDSLLEFPARFPIKALGRADGSLREAVMAVVAAHAEFDPVQDVREQASREGNFISVTVTFLAQSQSQVDTIYQSLHDHELVLMVF